MDVTDHPIGIENQCCSRKYQVVVRFIGAAAVFGNTVTVADVDIDVRLCGDAQLQSHPGFGSAKYILGLTVAQVGNPGTRPGDRGQQITAQYIHRTHGEDRPGAGRHLRMSAVMTDDGDRFGLAGHTGTAVTDNIMIIARGGAAMGGIHHRLHLGLTQNLAENSDLIEGAIGGIAGRPGEIARAVIAEIEGVHIADPAVRGDASHRRQ